MPVYVPLICFEIEANYFLPILLQSLLLSFLFNSLLYIWDSIISFLQSSFRLPDLIHTFSAYLSNCWLIKLLCTMLSSVKLYFLEVSCPKVGTFPCETCLVVNKSKYFTYFSVSSLVPATPDHICPLLNAQLHLINGAPAWSSYTTVSYQKFPNLNFWGSLFLPNYNILHFSFLFFLSHLAKSCFLPLMGVLGLQSLMPENSKNYKGNWWPYKLWCYSVMSQDSKKPELFNSGWNSTESFKRPCHVGKKKKKQTKRPHLLIMALQGLYYLGGYWSF